MSVKIPCNYDDRFGPPVYASEDAAGADLMAAIPSEIVLESGSRIIVPTGIRIEIPPGYEAQVRPRSGLAYKHGITVLNSPGTIDSDYRGEIKVILINHGQEEYTIKPGERIAQLIFSPVTRVDFFKTDNLQSSRRNEGGFGSTGR